MEDDHLGDERDRKLPSNGPKEGNPVYNAVCLEVQNGTPGPAECTQPLGG